MLGLPDIGLQYFQNICRFLLGKNRNKDLAFQQIVCGLNLRQGNQNVSGKLQFFQDNFAQLPFEQLVDSFKPFF
jgi:hypothetical protein